MWSVANVFEAGYLFNFSNRMCIINGARITISRVNFQMLEKRPRRLLRTLAEQLKTHSMAIYEI
jgi:hypothetical protein